jgi:hypothetical protein
VVRVVSVVPVRRGAPRAPAGVVRAGPRTVTTAAVAVPVPVPAFPS